MAAADQKKGKRKKKKCSPVYDKKHAFVWGLHCNVGHFITSLLFLAVSDIPWDSSLSSQALALFLSYFI